MGWVCVLRDAQPLPLSDVIVSNVGEIDRIGSVTREVCNDCHRLDANDAFECKVSLVSMRPSSAPTTQAILKCDSLTRVHRQSHLLKSDFLA